MGRFWTGLLVAAVVVAGIPRAGAAQDGQPPEISAASAVVMEAGSGRILYEKDAESQRLIASVTKLLTALTALETGHSPQEVVEIQPSDTGIEGSSIYLRAGERLRLETLLYGMLLQSGNDAATAVARYCAGSVEAFAGEMNALAGELGMADSHFTNPSGLNEAEHYSTALDLARLARACLNNETLAQIAATRSITLEGRTFVNHNKLLWRYPGCVGLKTGYTEKAGRTLVSAASRDGMTLIAVTLDAPNDWADHTALLDWGFDTFHLTTLVEEGAQVTTLPTWGSLSPWAEVTAGRAVMFPLAEGEAPEEMLALEETELTAPVAAGCCVGELRFFLEGKEIGAAPLVVSQGVTQDMAQRRSFLDWLLGWLR